MVLLFMKDLFKYYKTDKIIKLSFLISGSLLFCEIIYILFLYSFLPPYIPIFNQLPWGEERLGAKIEIFFALIITMIFFIFNFFLLNQLYEKMPLIARMIAITTLLICIISSIFTLQTLQLIL